MSNSVKTTVGGLWSSTAFNQRRALRYSREEEGGGLTQPPHNLEERKSLLEQMKILKNSSVVLQRDPHIAAISLGRILTSPWGGGRRRILPVPLVARPLEVQWEALLME
eukprot:GHVU01003781.1.p1 GENE.GHVU01003781.1~~GHVU01003781.1.p1  ORF type:complete len:109 (-),score=11.12 GHVU01003781.1:1392-1718(-)